MIKRLSLVLKNNDVYKTEEDEIDINSKQYNDLLKIYEIAMIQIENNINVLKDRLNRIYGYPIIDKVTSRVKTNKSILNKLKKKSSNTTYKRLVEDINDIAGVRVVCPLKEDILPIKQIIERMPNIKVVKEKDYINKPKRSGYSAYHMIIETPVNINGEIVIIKVEIQIRTTAMDLWAEMEHDIRYKSKNNISLFDSKRLTIYAKCLEKIQNKLVKLYRKKEKESIYYMY